MPTFFGGTKEQEQEQERSGSAALKQIMIAR
jgi:hypothetical protein